MTKKILEKILEKPKFSQKQVDEAIKSAKDFISICDDNGIVFPATDKGTQYGRALLAVTERNQRLQNLLSDIKPWLEDAKNAPCLCREYGAKKCASYLAACALELINNHEHNTKLEAKTPN